MLLNPCGIPWIDSYPWVDLCGEGDFPGPALG